MMQTRNDVMVEARAQQVYDWVHAGQIQQRTGAYRDRPTWARRNGRLGKGHCVCGA